MHRPTESFDEDDLIKQHDFADDGTTGLVIKKFQLAWFE